MTAITYLLSPSHFDVKRTIESLSNYCIATGLNKKQIFEISVCIAEALNNIIEHTFGTTKDRNNIIALSCKISPVTISMEIKHKAQEFVITLSEPDNLLATSGRGWYIMDSLLDELFYKHKNGINRINMLKNLKD
jgi:anti-sigma regulatory factor (Ser/Thr protein kinase)